MNELNFKFPARFTFNLIRNIETGEQYVTAQKTTNQKVTMNNIKYWDVYHFSYEQNKKVALLDVKDVKSESELAEMLDKYEQNWGIKPHVEED